MKQKFKYYQDIFRRFGMRAVMFLIQSKFLGNKRQTRRIRGLEHPVYLSNFGPDVATLFQIFFAEEYKMPFSIKPKVILDCGANIGLAAIYYASRYPAAKIIAIEPDTNNFYFLQKNAGFYPNILCLNCAVWSHATTLNIVDSGNGNWALQTRKITTPGQQIPAIGVQEIFEKYNLTEIDILKVDIEGAEREMFSKNCQSWLPKVKSIAIELHENIDKDIPSIFYGALAQYSYKRYFVGENVICDLQQAHSITKSVT